jgi:hypothetical protein
MDQRADEVSVVGETSEGIVKAILQVVKRGIVKDAGHFDDEEVCLKVVGQPVLVKHCSNKLD